MTVKILERVEDLSYSLEKNLSTNSTFTTSDNSSIDNPNQLKLPERIEDLLYSLEKNLSINGTFTTSDNSSIDNIDKGLAKPYIQSWYSKSMSQLKTLELLSKNWKNDEMLPPNRHAFYWASEALEILREINFPCDRIAASIEGGICIAFLSPNNKNKYADIEFFNNSEILAATTDRISNPKIWKVSFGNMRKSLKEIRRFINAN